MTNSLASTVQAHKALAHSARIRILAMLKGGDLCVCQLTAVLALAPSTVSAHLAELRRAGMVTERKEGRWVHYALGTSPAAGKYLELLWSQLRGDQRVAEDEVAVKSLRAIPVDEFCAMSAQTVQHSCAR